MSRPQNSRFLLPRVFRRFMEMESAGGVVMLAATALALIAVNGPLYEAYHAFSYASITLGLADFRATEPLKVWVKDILMVFFFLIVGLELKREMKEGVLSRRDQVMLPLFAALGGMVVPALFFLGWNLHIPEHWAGWAIPSATDIAFAVCVLTLAGKNIAPAVKIFLLAIAIFDDLGAILVIAFFYGGALSAVPLAVAGVGIAILALLNKMRVSAITPYMLVGLLLWFCLFHGGVHTTLAGVLVGIFMPMRCHRHPTHSPVNQCIHFLHPWVAFGVLPLFAFTCAGISLEGITAADVLGSLPLGIALALFLGKQVGVFGVTWAMVKLRVVQRPEGAEWLHIYAVSVLAGIGFTMSLFIGILAFPEALQHQVKIGVIFGSLLSALWGVLILQFVGHAKKP